MTWTIAGYAQDFLKRHLDDNIFEAHKDKLDVIFFTQKGRTDPIAGLLGIAITCPVPAPLYSGVLEKLISKLEKQLGLPQSRWNTDESDIEGYVLLRLFFGREAEA